MSGGLISPTLPFIKPLLFLFKVEVESWKVHASAKCVLPQMSRLLQRIEYSIGQRRRCGRRCRRPNNNIMMKELLWFSLSASLSASVQRWVHNKCHCLSIGCYGLVIDFVKLTIMRSISLAVFICHRSSKLLHRWAHSRFTPKRQAEKEEEGSALGILRQRKFPILQSTSMKSTMI